MFESIINAVRSVGSDRKADARLISTKRFRVVIQCAGEWQTYTASSLQMACEIGQQEALLASRRQGGQQVTFVVIALCNRCHGSCVDHANGGGECGLCEGTGITATVAKEWVMS